MNARIRLTPQPCANVFRNDAPRTFQRIEELRPMTRKLQPSGPDEFIELAHHLVLSKGNLNGTLQSLREGMGAARNQLYIKHRILNGLVLRAVVEAMATDSATTEALSDAGTSQLQFMDSLVRRGSMLDFLLANGAYVVDINVRGFAYGTSAPIGNVTPEGEPKPLQQFTFASPTGLTKQKCAALCVITDDLAKSAMATSAIRKILLEACASAANAIVVAATIGSGTQEVSAAGSSAAQIVTALANAVALLSTHAGSRLVLFLPPAAVLSLSLKTDTTGALAFPNVGQNGGDIGAVQIVAADTLDAHTGLLMDATQIVVAATPLELQVSTEGAVWMTDNPTSPANQVSLWQTNSQALFAERWVSIMPTGDSVAVIEALDW